MKKQEKVLLVLGMHRSGTSSVAGVLCKLGGTAPETLYGAFESNPKGHWESEAIFRLNDRILESFGSNWADWRAVPGSFAESKQAKAFRSEAIQTFKSEYKGGSLPVLKDPRICRLMPFWTDVLRALKMDIHVVTPLRSPLDAARSLEARGGIPIVVGVHIWLRHVLDAEFASRGMPRTIFTWASFLEDWQEAVVRIAQDAGISWPIQLENAAAEIDKFLSKDLRHYTAEREDHPHVHAWAASAYDAMIGLSAGERPELHDRLDRIKAAFNETSDLFGYFAADYHENKRLNQNVADLTKTVAAYEDNITNYKTLTDRYEAEIEEHWAARAQLEGEKANLVQSVANLTEAMESHKNTLADYKALTDKYTTDIEEHWAARAHLEGEKANFAQQAANLAENLRTCEASIDDYKTLTERYVTEIKEHWTARERLEGEKANLAQQAANLAENLKTYEASIDDYKTLTDRYEAEIKEHWIARGQLEKEKIEFGEQIGRLTMSAKADFETLTTALAKARDRVFQVENEGAELRTKLHGLERLLDRPIFRLVRRMHR